jgi:PAS domain S-box-containing protein
MKRPAAVGDQSVFKRASSPAAQFGFTLGAVALATLLRFALAPVLGEGAPFILYYPTVVLCAWLWGLWPGVLATVLGGLGAWYFFIPPTYSFSVSNPAAPAWLSLYLVAGVLISLMAESSHAAWRRSQQAEAREREAHARDLVERNRTQQELLDSRERLRMVIEGSPIAKVMVDCGGSIVLINAQMERLFGYTRAELIGQPVEMLVPERFRRRHPQYRAEFADAPQTRPMGAGRDLYGLRKDGSEVPIEIGLNPIEVEGETLVLSAIVDLTERKRAEAALTAAAHQHEALYEFVARLQRAGSFVEIYDAGLDAMLNALGCDRASILLHDEKKMMRFVASRGLSEGYRSAVEGHSPWAPDEANPQPVSESDIAASVFDEHLKALLKDEGIAALAFIPLVISGKLGGKFMTYYNAPHVFDDVELDLSLSIARQLGIAIERKRAEEALREANRHKDEFLAILSHELRNPLAALATAAQVLDHSAHDGERADEARGVITRQTELMTHLIEDLLDVSRVTMGKMALDRAPLDLAHVVSNVVQTWRSAGRIDGSRLSLKVAPAWIDGDRLRVEQVFANLLDNALKFTPADKDVRVSVEQKDGEAVLRVADEGEGVTPGLIAQVFDPFVQGARPQRSRGGLGLGLALVKRLTELHGGTVEVASAGPGRGAVFTVRFPSVANPQVHAATPAARQPGGGRRILVIDDNEDARRMLEAVLALDGHLVQGARDGESGLALAAESPPEVAVIDIGLPDIDGYEVARRLRTTRSGRRIALIALTGFGQAEDQRRAYAAGFDAHLTKPVTPDKLARTIAQLL